MRAPLLRSEVPLAPSTTFGIGGPARLFADVSTAEELRDAVLWAERNELPYTVLGRGSNVLVGDDGFDGLAIRNARSGRFELLPGGRLRAESGVGIDRLIATTVGRGLSGLEHFAGIPSTLGGALWQNLHFLAPDRSGLVYAGDLVESASVLVDGTVERVGRDWFGFGYDESRLRAGGAVLLEATLRLAAADPAVLRAVVLEDLIWRAERHPPAAASRSAGCVFRNPPGASAARAIEAAGLKGLQVGGAVVSIRHANFVLNAGGATASDVRALIDLVVERVARHSGLLLEPELAFVDDPVPQAGRWPRASRGRRPPASPKPRYVWLGGSSASPAAERAST
ncbi:MAG TPA: UDP-N-acetylmuramate dehydrogenase [Gaiellaceae bacterium]|jgi:UDP-N-acetylmuramate dehydrogenase|nr:UDP-N-acetylmuramate dehydrogenase [Gaiellaceae bacterium]